MVIECFKDHAAASNTPVWYGYHKDAHTSLVGIRESTKLHRCFTSDEEVDIWINSGGLGGPRARQLGLFAYPGQSNMTGRRLPLNWYVCTESMFQAMDTDANVTQARPNSQIVPQGSHIHIAGRGCPCKHRTTGSV